MTVLSPQDLIRQYRKQSWQKARKEWEGQRQACHGRLEYELADQTMVIRINVRARCSGDNHLRWDDPLSSHQRFKGTWMELEVLENQGKYGFLMRLVKRGFPMEGGVEDLAEFIFKIPKLAATYLHYDRKVVPTDPAEQAVITAPLTPSQFQLLFRVARNCTVIMGGELLFVTSLFHQHKVHWVGADLDPELIPSPERRLIDMN